MNKFTKKELLNIKKVSTSKLKKKVINVILNCGSVEEMTCFINDLLNHGCQSGIVGELIYYNDTMKFYKKYKNEIKKLLTEQISEYGYNSPYEMFGSKWDQDDIFCKDTNNQNLLAWYGFEEVTRNIAYELNLEI